MRIGLDARTMFAPRPRGTGRNLCDAYRTLAALRRDWAFVLYHRRAAGESELLRADAGATFLDSPNVRAEQIDCVGDRWDLWLHVRLVRRARHDRIDVLHLPANEAPLCSAVPIVATIHDLIPLRVSNEVTGTEHRRFRRRVQRVVRTATRIITPSQATYDDVIADFGVEPARMVVVPWAADCAVQAVTNDAAAYTREAERVRGEYALQRRWLLNFAGPSPRKNAERIVRAFAELPAGVRASVLLVLVGCEPAALRESLQRLAREVGVESRCRFLGFVPHAHVPGFLCGSAGLVMPSLYEGFGLPVIDAFTARVPVLTSQHGAMREVAGDAAELCDPYDVASIATGMLRLLHEPRAAELVARGVERAKQYTWQRTAESMAGVLKAAVSAAEQHERGGRAVLTTTGGAA